MNRIQLCKETDRYNLEYACDGYPLRVFEKAGAGLVRTDNFEITDCGFRMTATPSGEVWAECIERSESDGEGFVKVVIPHKGGYGFAGLGYNAYMPDGTPIPYVGKITISSEADDYTRVSIECLAEIIPSYDAPDPGGALKKNGPEIDFGKLRSKG